MIAPILATTAHAGPTDAITVEAADDTLGPAFPTGFRAVTTFRIPYVEEEWLASGAATLFTYHQQRHVDSLHAQRLPAVRCAAADLRDPLSHTVAA